VFASVKFLVNRVWLTPFSAPLESTRSPEVNSRKRGARKLNDELATTTARGIRDANGGEDWPGIVSRFQLVLLAGRRSKQLLRGAHPRIPADPLKRRNTSIALEELRRGLVPFTTPYRNGAQISATGIDTVENPTRVEQATDFDSRSLVGQ
jgi:DNA-directed RNA polymerase omega subunit